MAEVVVRKFTTFADFYPFYLGEHRNPVCRVLHFIGTSVGLSMLIVAFITKLWWLIPVGIVQGYAWAWVGHFGFEKNKPASFKRPLYSFIGDWRMYADIWRGRIPF